MSEPAQIIDIVEAPPEPIVEQIYSDAIYDACDTPVSHDANPATMGAIVETERKIFLQIKLLLTQIKGLRDDELKEMLDKFVSIYRNSFERCVFLPEPEGCEEVDPHAALRHHLSLRLDQWNEWFADKGVDRTLGRRFKDPNSKNKARMEGDEAIGLEEMKQRIQQIEQERLYEAELQKYQADQEKLEPHPVISNAEAKRLEKEKKSEARRCARAERAKEKKRQKDVEFLKTVTLECAVGYVDASTLEIYKAKCHLCEDRLTDPKYMIIHEKIKHPMMFFCHYCDRTFAAHGPMRVHCETVHLGLPIDPPGRRPPERANCTKSQSVYPNQQQAVPQQQQVDGAVSRANAGDNDGVNQVVIDELKEAESDKDQSEPIPPDPAPKLTMQRAKLAQSKSPRRGRSGSSKRRSTTALTAAMPMLNAEDKFELDSFIDVEMSDSPEATFKKRPIAVVAPMTKNDTVEDDGGRPGPSGLNRRTRGSNRLRAVSNQSDANVRQETVHSSWSGTGTSSPILMDPAPTKIARRMKIYEEFGNGRMKAAYKVREMESDDDESDVDEMIRSVEKYLWQDDERLHVRGIEKEDRSYSRRNRTHRTCSLPPYGMVKSPTVYLKRYFSESDVSVPMTASGFITGIDEVLKRFGLNSSSSSSSFSDSSFLSDSEFDISSPTTSDAESEMGYNERLVRFIISQPGTAQAMAAFLEKEKLRAKKREAIFAEELLLKMLPSTPLTNTLDPGHSKVVSARQEDALLALPDATKHQTRYVNPPPTIAKSSESSTSLATAKQAEHPPAAATSKAKVVVPHPLLLKGKARATALLAKMKAAVLARQQQMPDDGTDQSPSASDEEESDVEDSIRGNSPEKKGVSRASELLARMKKAAQARAAENPSSSDDEEDDEQNMGSVRGKSPEKKGISRASELLARMKKAAQARAAQNLSDSSDSDEGKQVGAKARARKKPRMSKAKSNRKAKGGRKANTGEKKGRRSTAKRIHPPSSDEAPIKSEALPIVAPPTKRNRGRPRKASALA